MIKKKIKLRWQVENQAREKWEERKVYFLLCGSTTFGKVFSPVGLGVVDGLYTAVNLEKKTEHFVLVSDAKKWVYDSFAEWLKNSGLKVDD